MLHHNKKISIDNNRSYIWYDSRQIIETRGGYSGRLIHGVYKAFFLNNQLKEQGNVRYGIKVGQWKYWYQDGHLREIINWKHGRKNGSYYLFNDHGELMAKGRFKNDKLNGKFYTYGFGGKIADKKKYRRGNEISRKRKKKIDANTRQLKNDKVKKEEIKLDDKAGTVKSPAHKRKINWKILKKRKTPRTPAPEVKEAKIIVNPNEL